MSGFFDFLRMAMGWWSAGAASATIDDPCPIEWIGTVQATIETVGIAQASIEWVGNVQGDIDATLTVCGC
jgi:hypothetical protein